MTPFLRWLLTLLSLLLLHSCASDDMAQSRIYQEIPLQITYREWQQQAGDCQADGKQGCATVSLRYPEARNGSPFLCESLNAFVHEYVLQVFEGLMPDQPAQASLDSVLAGFFADYHQHRAQFPHNSLSWKVEVQGEVIYQSDRWLTLRMLHRESLGGAEAQTWTRYLMLERHTGRTLAPSDLVQHPTRLQQLVETRLRTQLGLSQDADLARKGFLFPAGPFPLLDNFGLTDQGLTICYNAYEVAPAELGSTQVHIPMQELRRCALHQP